MRTPSEGEPLKEDSKYERYRHFNTPPNMEDYESSKNFQIEVPKYYNFGFDVVDERAKDRSKLALIVVNDLGDREDKYSFWDVKLQSNKMANVFRNHGIEKGDTVLLALPRIAEWQISLVALIKQGAIAVPSTIMLTAKDLNYRINASQAKAVITDSANAPKIDEISTECPNLKEKFLVGDVRVNWTSLEDEMKQASHVFENVPKNRSTDQMLMYFTSGTEAHPKMVLHTHDYPLGHLVTAKFWQDLKPTDLHWTLADTGWAKAAWGNIFGQWIVGATVLQHNARGRFDPKLTLDLLQKYAVTTFCAAPTAYRLLIKEDLKKYDLSELRHCFSAGEPLNPEVIRIWREGIGLLIYDGYGQTETCNLLANFRCLDVKWGSMGKPAPGWDVMIVDDEGNELPNGEEGHIAVNLREKRPIGLLKEYWNNPSVNSNSFRNGLYYTGDKAYRDDDGYFWFVGRADDVIKSAGYRIGPFEVESALIEHPAVLEAAVVGKPDELRGSIVKAYVVLTKHYSPSEDLKKELQDHVKKVTAPYRYPREIEFVSELPKTISGKIQRSVLRKREEDSGSK